jgi:putative DNA primase/helicase
MADEKPTLVLLTALSTTEDMMKAILKEALSRTITDQREHALARELWVMLRELGLRVCVSARGLFIYNDNAGDGLWRPLSDSTLISFAHQLAAIRTQVLDRDEMGPINFSSRKARAVAECFRHLPKVAAYGAMERATPGIGFTNGFLEIDPVTSRCELVPHSHEHYATAGLPYAWDEDAACPRFLQFLNEIFKEDPHAADKQALILEFLGVCFLGRATGLQKCLLLAGSGGNGKSTLLDIVREIFPEDLRSSLTPKDIEGRFRLAVLDGRLVNIIDETPKDRWEASETLKAIITGGVVLVENKHRDPYEMRARAGHIFALNEVPRTADLTQGLWRRFIFIGFNRNFVAEGSRREGHEIVAELRAELSGIVAWCVRHGLRALARRGYTIPESHHEELKQWQTENDSVHHWVEEEGIKPIAISDPASAFGYERHRSKTLYVDYCHHCETRGLKACSTVQWSKRLQALGFARSHKSDGVYYWYATIPETH